VIVAYSEIKRNNKNHLANKNARITMLGKSGQNTADCSLWVSKQARRAILALAGQTTGKWQKFRIILKCDGLPSYRRNLRHLPNVGGNCHSVCENTLKNKMGTKKIITYCLFCKVIKSW
jgi:hypothetical protein